MSGAGAGIAVIVPVLDEEARVGGLLDALAAQPGLGPVVIVDGGSADRTVEVARARGATVIAAPRGRAAQMNAGAAATGGEVLLFLHADTRLPSGAAAQIRGVLAEPGTVAGAFRTWTVNDDPRGRRRWLAPLLHLADVRSRVRRLPYGDQALFVRRDAFEAAGGFPPLPLMEDLALARALRRRGRIGLAPGRVQVSGRRFLAHPIRYTVLINIFPLLWRLGVPAERLAAVYRHVR